MKRWVLGIGGGVVALILLATGILGALANFVWALFVLLLVVDKLFFRILLGF